MRLFCAMDLKSRFGYLGRVDDIDPGVLTSLGDIDTATAVANAAASAALINATASLSLAEGAVTDAATAAAAATAVTAAAAAVSTAADIPGATTALANANALLASATNAENDIASANSVLSPLGGAIATVSSTANTAKSNAVGAENLAGTAKTTADNALADANDAVTEFQRQRDFVLGSPVSSVITKTAAATSSGNIDLSFTTIDSNGISTSATEFTLPENKRFFVSYVCNGFINTNGHANQDQAYVKAYIANTVGGLYDEQEIHLQLSAVDIAGRTRNSQVGAVVNTAGSTLAQRTISIQLELLGPATGEMTFNVIGFLGYLTIYEI